MTIFRFSVACAFAALPCIAQETAPPPRVIHLPSGLAATALGLLWEPQTSPAELWLRARFLVPDLAGKIADFEATGKDLLALCREQVLPAIRSDGRKVALAVVSMSAEPLAFGETRPDVAQVFEAYRLETGDCILDGF